MHFHQYKLQIIALLVIAALVGCSPQDATQNDVQSFLPITRLVARLIMQS